MIVIRSKGPTTLSSAIQFPILLDLKRLNQILLHLRERVNCRYICSKPHASHRFTTHLKGVFFFCILFFFIFFVVKLPRKSMKVSVRAWVSILYLNSVLYTCQNAKYRQHYYENSCTLPTCREFSYTAISSSFPIISPHASSTLLKLFYDVMLIILLVCFTQHYINT